MLPRGKGVYVIQQALVSCRILYPQMQEQINQINLMVQVTITYITEKSASLKGHLSNSEWLQF